MRGSLVQSPCYLQKLEQQRPSREFSQWSDDAGVRGRSIWMLSCSGRNDASSPPGLPGVMPSQARLRSMEELEGHDHAAAWSK